MQEKIKVLHILPNLSNGGAERVCVNILKNLNQEIFSPVLLLFKENGEGEDMKLELASTGVPVISLKKRLLIDPLNLYQIIKVVNDFTPDIIHTHLGGDIYGLIAGKLKKTKIIVSTEHNINKNERKVISKFKKINSQFFTKIFAVSQAVREDSILKYEIAPDKITVLYNGIDIDLLTKPEAIESSFRLDSENKVIIGALGRLSSQKGFICLIEAAAKTKNKNYLINIGGKGELEGELKKRIKDLELINRIQLVGEVKTKKFLQNIDIFVLPSLWEGLGLVILEAGAIGKPIISSGVDGVREILNEENSFFFPVGDDDKLAETIDLVISNLHTSDTQKKIQNLQNIIKEKFSLTDMVKRYSDWYQKLFDEKI